MAEVKLGLGPSLREKEMKIQELIQRNSSLTEKLNLTQDCLKDLEEKTKLYCSQVLELRDIVEYKDKSIETLTEQLQTVMQQKNQLQD